MMRTLSRYLVGACSTLVLVAGAGWHAPAAASEPFIGQIQ